MSHLFAIRALGRSAGLALLLAGSVAPASAAALVDGTYDIMVGGFNVGVGGFKAVLTPRAYTATVTMRLTGFASMMSDGRGSATSVGSVTETRPVPANYLQSTSSGKYTQTIRIGLLAGAVRVVAITPAPRPRPDVVPVTPAHRRGVVDPVGALVMPMSGNGELLSPAACQRTLPVFDGRQRFDIRLAFDRMDKVAATGSARSYAGPVVVCRANYLPVAGHRLRSGQARQADMPAEVWLVPVAGTRVLVPWKISVKTSSGQAVIQARTLAIRGTAEPAQPGRAAPEQRSDIRRAELRPTIRPDRPAEPKPVARAEPPVAAGAAAAPEAPPASDAPPPAEAPQP